MHKNNFTQIEIAKVINKSKSTISRELKRNSDQRNKTYKYDLAQKKYEKRQKEKPKKIKLTSELKKYIEEKIKEDLSPEQIYGESKLKDIECVSHETIYQYIWTNKKQGGVLYKHLRRHGRRYRKRGHLKDNRGIIKDRVSIDQRPPEVDEKQRFGDFEIDTIIGKNHNGAILTINDRKTSFVKIKKLTGKNAKELAEQTIKILMPIKHLIHTITGDNGKEFAEHKQIAEALNIDFYFAHPYHSWERGANENTNGLLRQYIPKSTDFKNITDEEIMIIQNKLNNRPRKKLNYFSPLEFIDIFEKININNIVAFIAWM